MGLRGMGSYSDKRYSDRHYSDSFYFRNNNKKKNVYVCVFSLYFQSFMLHRVRTILALGYWVLPNIFQYWVLLGIGQYSYWLSYPIPIVQYCLDTMIPVASR